LSELEMHPNSDKSEPRGRIFRSGSDHNPKIGVGVGVSVIKANSDKPEPRGGVFRSGSDPDPKIGVGVGVRVHGYDFFCLFGPRLLWWPTRCPKVTMSAGKVRKLNF
jgi:hypothetical protein